MAMNDAIRQPSMKLVLIVMMAMTLVSPVLGGVEHCPPAKVGRPYILTCTGQTTSHHRVVNWERDTRDGYLLTIASCAQNRHTSKCNSPEMQEECQKRVEDENLYTASSCISNSSNSNDNDNNKIHNNEINSNNSNDINDTNQNGNAEVGNYFRTSLILKKVNEWDNGAIFQCKVLDWKTNMIQIEGSCELKVTHHRYHHRRHHGRHHRRNQAAEGHNDEGNHGASSDGAYSQASLLSQIGCSSLVIFTMAINFMMKIQSKPRLQ